MDFAQCASRHKLFFILHNFKSKKFFLLLRKKILISAARLFPSSSSYGAPNLITLNKHSCLLLLPSTQALYFGHFFSFFVAKTFDESWKKDIFRICFFNLFQKSSSVFDVGWLAQWKSVCPITNDRVVQTPPPASMQ